MNMFILAHTPEEIARYHHNVHLNKMILETAQLLSTTVRMIDPKFSDDVDKSVGSKLYKQTHANHPCAVWMRESHENFEFGVDLLEALLNEYLYRRDKVHATYVVYETINHWAEGYSNLILPFTSFERTQFPLCMPDEYKTNDVIESYRNYYRAEKMTDKNGRSLANWGTRCTPHWI